MFASYGSGNTMVVFSARVAESAPQVISTWNLREKIFGTVRPASYQEYLNLTQSPYSKERFTELMAGTEIPGGSYYLKEIRGDGYHEYGYQ